MSHKPKKEEGKEHERKERKKERKKGRAHNVRQSKTVLDPGGYSTNIWVEVSHWGFETLTLFTTRKFLEQKSKNRAKPSILLPCLGQTSAKLYTLLRTERTKTIPCPETHPRIGHIRSTPRVSDSRFHAVHSWSLSEELRFWIPKAVFRTPKHRIPYPTNFPEIRNPNSLTLGETHCD